MDKSSIHHKGWDEIIYPFPNFKAITEEVWEWISDLFHLALFWPCNYLSMLGFRLIYVSRHGPVYPGFCRCRNRRNQHFSSHVFKIFRFHHQKHPKQQSSWGRQWAHLGPVGPRWPHVGPMNLVIRASANMMQRGFSDSGPNRDWLKSTRGWFNINMPSTWFRKSHRGDKMVIRSSYIQKIRWLLYIESGAARTFLWDNFVLI